MYLANALSWFVCGKLCMLTYILSHRWTSCVCYHTYCSSEAHGHVFVIGCVSSDDLSVIGVSGIVVDQANALSWFMCDKLCMLTYILSHRWTSCVCYHTYCSSSGDLSVIRVTRVEPSNLLCM